MKLYKAFIQYYTLGDDDYDSDFTTHVELVGEDDSVLPALVREATRVGRAAWPKKADRMSIAVESTPFPTVVYSQQGIKKGARR